MMTTKKSTALVVENALQYFFADSEWTFKAGVGCLINGAAFGLLIINLLLLPLCFCLWSLTAGYVLATAKAKTKQPDCKLPPWSDWLELLIAGGIWVAVWTAYQFLIVVIAVISLAIGGMSGLTNI